MWSEILTKLAAPCSAPAISKPCLPRAGASGSAQPPLLLAGVFLIRYAVEQALLGPAARCVARRPARHGTAGGRRVADAPRVARHFPARSAPTRPPAGLAAGGTAILFGAAYGAGPFYRPAAAAARIPPAWPPRHSIALTSALRYGPLTAATGIVGAFATPALVTTQEPSLPGLFAYLFVVSAAALRGVVTPPGPGSAGPTMAAGALWVWLTALAGGPDLWAAAAFVIAAAALNLVLLPAAALDHPVGRRLAWVPIAVIAVAGLELEIRIPAPRRASPCSCCRR